MAMAADATGRVQYVQGLLKEKREEVKWLRKQITEEEQRAIKISQQISRKQTGHEKNLERIREGTRVKHLEYMRLSHRRAQKEASVVNEHLQVLSPSQGSHMSSAPSERPDNSPTSTSFDEFFPDSKGKDAHDEAVLFNRLYQEVLQSNAELSTPGPPATTAMSDSNEPDGNAHEFDGLLDSVRHDICAAVIQWNMHVMHLEDKVQKLEKQLQSVADSSASPARQAEGVPRGTQAVATGTSVRLRSQSDPQILTPMTLSTSSTRPPQVQPQVQQSITAQQQSITTSITTSAAT